MTTPRVYSYRRFSTPIQMHGTSLRRQTLSAEEWAKNHGLTLDEATTITDRGLSAFKGEQKTKGELGTFLKKVQTGEIPRGSFLLVDDPSRLSRESPRIFLADFLNLVNNGIKLVFLNSTDDSGEPRIISEENCDEMELIRAIIESGKSHKESLEKQRVARKNWEFAREAAQKGEIVTSKCPGWLKVTGRKKIGNRITGGRFETIPERVQVVQDIFKWRLNGIGVINIVRRLNDSNVPTWGKPKKKDIKKSGWSHSQVRDVLMNRAVLGELILYKGPVNTAELKKKNACEPVTDYYPRIISDQDFNRVQSLMKEFHRSAGKNGDHVSNLLTDIGKCATCGGPMVYSLSYTPREDGTKRKYDYLTCANAKRRVAGGQSEEIKPAEKLSLILRRFETMMQRDWSRWSKTEPVESIIRAFRQKNDIIKGILPVLTAFKETETFQSVDEWSLHRLHKSLIEFVSDGRFDHDLESLPVDAKPIPLCNNTSAWKYPEFEERFLSFLFDQIDVRDLTSEPDESSISELETVRNERDSVKNQLDEWNRKIERWTDSIADYSGNNPERFKETITTRIDEGFKNLDRLEERLKELDQDILILSSRTESAEDALNDMRGLIRFMKETEDDQKRNEVRSRLRARLLSIIDRVEIAPAGYTSSPYDRFQLMERVQKGEPLDPKVLTKGGHHALTHFIKADPEFLIEDGIPKKMIFKDRGGNVIEREIQPSGEPNEFELKSVMNDWLSDALGMVEGSEDLTKTQKGKVSDRLKEIFPIMMIMEMMDYERLTMGMSSKDKTRRNIGLRSFIIHFKSGKERVVGPAAFDVEQPDSEGLRDLTTIQEPDSIHP